MQSKETLVTRMLYCVIKSQKNRETNGQGVGDQVKISGAYCCYVALATAVLHGLGRMGVPVERDKADLGPVVV